MTFETKQETFFTDIPEIWKEYLGKVYSSYEKSWMSLPSFDEFNRGCIEPNYQNHSDKITFCSLSYAVFIKNFKTPQQLKELHKEKLNEALTKISQLEKKNEELVKENEDLKKLHMDDLTTLGQLVQEKQLIEKNNQLLTQRNEELEKKLNPFEGQKCELCWSQWNASRVFQCACLACLNDAKVVKSVYLKKQDC